MIAWTGLLSAASGSESFYCPKIHSIPVFAPQTEREGLRKSRVGGWRILFTVDRAAKVMYVLTVDARGQVYKHS